MRTFFSISTIITFICGSIFFMNSLALGNDREEISQPLQRHFRNNMEQRLIDAPQNAAMGVNIHQRQDVLDYARNFRHAAIYTVIVGYSIICVCSALNKSICLAETSKSFYCNPTLLEHITPTGFFVNCIKTLIFFAVFFGAHP